MAPLLAFALGTTDLPPPVAAQMQQRGITVSAVATVEIVEAGVNEPAAAPRERFRRIRKVPGGYSIDFY